MVQVGGAIVADSEPVSELDETYAKGRVLFETMIGNAFKVFRLSLRTHLLIPQEKVE